MGSVAEKGLAPALSSFHSNLPACKQGLPRILHWRPRLRNSRSYRSTLVQESAEEEAAALVSLLNHRHRNSQHNFPACNRGWPRILHWRPNFHNSDSHRCTLASAEARASAAVSAAVSAAASAAASAAPSAVVLAASRRRSSQHNLPACNRGLPHILHWRPSLRNSRSHRNILASAAALASVLVQRLAR